MYGGHTGNDARYGRGGYGGWNGAMMNDFAGGGFPAGPMGMGGMSGMMPPMPFPGPHMDPHAWPGMGPYFPGASDTGGYRRGPPMNAAQQLHQQHASRNPKDFNVTSDAVGASATCPPRHHLAVGGFSGYHRVPAEALTVTPTAPPTINETAMRLATKRQLDDRWAEFEALPTHPVMCSVRVAVRRPVAGTLPNRPKG